MTNQFDSALDATESAQERYGDQLGFVEGRTPFAAETMPDRPAASRSGALLKKFSRTE